MINTDQNQELAGQIGPKVGLWLSQLEKDDFDRLFLVASDPEIWLQHPDKLRYTKEVFQAFFEGAFGENISAFLVIHEKSGEVMGSSRFYRIDKDSKSVFAGYTFLARKWWGGYWNACLKFIMLERAFQEFDIVYFEAATSNLRSVSALKKLGAEEMVHQDAGKALFRVAKWCWPDIRERLLERINR